jgi:hypothetical protein
MMLSLYLILILFNTFGYNTQNAIKTEANPTTTGTPVEKIIFTADISSSRNFFIILHRHAIVVKEIMLWKYLQEMKGFCTNEYLPIHIKYHPSTTQTATVVTAYIESGSNELRDEQKKSSICRRVRT